MSNYRPISLSTSFSKIFEKVKQTRLVDHKKKKIYIYIYIYIYINHRTVWIQKKINNTEGYI